MKQPCTVPDHLGDFRITSYVITLMTPLITVQFVKRLSTLVSEMKEKLHVHYIPVSISALVQTNAPSPYSSDETEFAGLSNERVLSIRVFSSDSFLSTDEHYRNVINLNQLESEKI